MPSDSPTRYLSTKPNHQTIRLAGRYINAAKLAEGEDMDHSYCTRILRGDRVASVTYMQRMARALGMSIDGLLNAIRDARESHLESLRRRIG